MKKNGRGICGRLLQQVLHQLLQNDGFPLAANERVNSIAKPDVTRLDLMSSTSILIFQV